MITNYTIDLLKKEEMYILDRIDILNSNGVEESSPEKIGLRVMLEDIKESIGILKGFKEKSIYDQKGELKIHSDMNKCKWDTLENDGVSKFLFDKFSELKEISQAESSDEKYSPTYNTTVNLYNEVKGKDVNAFAESIMKELRKQQYSKGKGE